jgi:hypothetical protein
MTLTRSSRWIALAAASLAASCAGEIEPERIAASESNFVGAGTGLLGEYFDNVDFTAPRLTRTDRAVLFDWSDGSPDPSIGADTFSVRWTGQIEAPSTDVYTFYVSSDDGVRLWVDGQLIIDSWDDHPLTETSGTIAMTAGRLADIRVEYYEGVGLASVQLSWSSPSQLKSMVPMASLYPPSSPSVPATPAPVPSPVPQPPAAPAPAPLALTTQAGAQQRPSYNTGSGFFVVGNKLYDPNGNEFRIRGVNHLHWDAAGPGIPKTGANTERWDIDFAQPAATNIGLMQKSAANKMVPIAGNWDGTCDESTTTLSNIVSTWVSTAPEWQAVEKYALLNIANEWGPSNSTVWRDAYISAIAQIRAAGINATLVVDAGGCGQDNADLAQYASAVFNSDPQRNVVFDQHIYGNWSADGSSSWQTNLATGLDALAATGLPMIVGEFGPGRNIGPSPTMMTPGQTIQAADARGIGWIAWAWDDPAGEWSSMPTDDWFALSLTGDYQSSADLTTFGKDVVENATYGLKAMAKPASFVLTASGRRERRLSPAPS